MAYQVAEIKIENKSHQNEEIPFTYIENGMAWYPLRLESKLAKQLRAYHLIKKDIQFALKCCEQFLSKEFNMTHEMKKSFWATTVFTYAKCFTQAEGRGTKLEIETCLKNDNSRVKMQVLHKRLMTTRDGYLAHGGSTNHEEVQVLYLLNPDLTDKRGHLLVPVIDGVSISDEHLIEVSELIKIVHEHVDTKIEKIKEKLRIEMKEKPIEYWYDKLDLPK